MTVDREQPHYTWQEDIQDQRPLEALGILNSHVRNETPEDELKVLYDTLLAQLKALQEEYKDRGLRTDLYGDRVKRDLGLISWRYADEPDRAKFEKTSLLQQELTELRHSEASLRELADVEGINLDFNR